MKNCPNCFESDINYQWYGPGRILAYYCRKCGWHEEPHTPEQREIKTTKTARIDEFPGFIYEVYDQYGHILIYSFSYDTEQEAEEALLLDIELGKTDKEAGPYTAVLYPRSVEVQGKVYK